MSAQFATVTTAPALTSSSSWKITDDLDPTTEMPVDVWLPTGPPAVGDRVIYDVVAGQCIVTAAAVVQGVWRNFTPQLKNAAALTNITTTVTRGKYMILGKTCFAQADVIAGGASTGGCAITLPLTSKDRLLNCGTLSANGATTPADQCGMAYMLSNQAALVIVAYTNGFRDVVSGAIVRYNVTYELP